MILSTMVLLPRPATLLIVATLPLLVSACGIGRIIPGGGPPPKQVAAAIPTGEVQRLSYGTAARGVVQIFYDLVSSQPGAVFDVVLEVSQDAGVTFPLRARSVSGDVGPGVTPGPGKRISWDSGQDVERFVVEQFRFRVVAAGRPALRK